MIRFRLNAEVQVKFDYEGTHSSPCHRAEQCRFRRVTRRVVMAIDHCADAPGWRGGLHSSPLCGASRGQSFADQAEVCLQHPRAAARDGTIARSSERGGAMCGIMCDPFLIVALNVAALALFLLPADGASMRHACLRRSLSSTTNQNGTGTSDVGVWP